MAKNRFDLAGKVAVVTGGYGVLGGAIADGLAAANARVAIFGRRPEAAAAKAEALQAAGCEAVPLVADVLDEAQVHEAREALLRAWGQVDILVNVAGGNVEGARSDKRSVFAVPMSAFDEVVRLNLHGTVHPSFVFGEAMAERGAGSIVNISSMGAILAISGAMGYSVAKAAIDQFTRWLAADLARRHGDGLRVNAIAPGFFLGEQNRHLLINEDGSYTERGQAIIGRTPMGRFGSADEVSGAVQWLCSDAASFVTGVVIPVDGGFSIFSGV